MQPITRISVSNDFQKYFSLTICFQIRIGKYAVFSTVSGPQRWSIFQNDGIVIFWGDTIDFEGFDGFDGFKQLVKRCDGHYGRTVSLVGSGLNDDWHFPIETTFPHPFFSHKGLHSLRPLDPSSDFVLCDLRVLRP